MRNSELTLEPGMTIQRVDLHQAFGGQRQSGISPSSQTDYIMIFSMPPSPSNPYTDGWFNDGHFHYTGEGQSGDQAMKRGNKALRDHVRNGKTVHLFEGQAKGAPVTYLGRVALADFSVVDGLGSDGHMRSQFRFRFSPVTGGPAVLGLPIQQTSTPITTTVTTVPVEQHLTETYDLTKEAPTSENERREAKLVSVYLSTSGGAHLVRQRIDVAGAVRPIYTDLYDPRSNRLIEAKGSTSRNHIRMAIGQLLDYRRFLEPVPDLAILLPQCPADDLLGLLADLQISVIHQSDTGDFVEVA